MFYIWLIFLCALQHIVLKPGSKLQTKLFFNKCKYSLIRTHSLLQTFKNLLFWTLFFFWHVNNMLNLLSLNWFRSHFSCFSSFLAESAFVLLSLLTQTEFPCLFDYNIVMMLMIITNIIIDNTDYRDYHTTTIMITWFLTLLKWCES